MSESLIPPRLADVQNQFWHLTASSVTFLPTDKYEDFNFNTKQSANRERRCRNVKTRKKKWLNQWRRSVSLPVWRQHSLRRHVISKSNTSPPSTSLPELQQEKEQHTAGVFDGVSVSNTNTDTIILCAYCVCFSLRRTKARCSALPSRHKLTPTESSTHINRKSQITPAF